LSSRGIGAHRRRTNCRFQEGDASDLHELPVTLKGPQGNTVDVIVEDPEQMKNIRKGDQVEVVYTEAVAISVTPGTNK
jgi:hypothetical protein